MASADALETEDPEKKPATVPNKDYSFGWNGELGLGRRKKVGASDKQKEISLAPDVPDQAEGETVLIVTFVDGMQKTKILWRRRRSRYFFNVETRVRTCASRSSKRNTW